MKDIISKIKGMKASDALAYAKENKKTVEKAVLIFTLLVCLGIYAFGDKEKKEIQIEAAETEAYGSTLSESAILLNQIYVDVQGAVENPGVVKLQENARVFQAIEAAGGLVSLSDTSPLNLAQQLYDGDKLYVPFQGEVLSESGSDSGVTLVSGSTGNSSGGGNGKININTASSDELQSLSGIGIVTAGKIVDYRTNNGKFNKPEDIKNVSGIGDRTYENIKNDICV